MIFGAFGAHALKDRLDEYSLGVFETAVQYHFYHSLALLAVGVIALQLHSGGDGRMRFKDIFIRDLSRSGREPPATK